MTLLQLVMIVKDSSSVIRQTLQLVKPFIDYWTILDTGSTDQTEQIIREELKNIEGNLYQENFIDFSTSRNRVLDLATLNCKYTFMLDDSFQLYNGEKLRSFLQQTDCDSFDIAILDKSNLYYSRRILKTEKRLRYKYRVHEIIPTTDHKTINYFDSEIYLFDYRDWKSELRSQNRLKLYLKILKEDHLQNPVDTRLIYYLAHTYNEMGQMEQASFFYRKRIELGQNPNDEEVYLSYYLLGSIEERKRNWDQALNFYHQAYIYSPDRAEPLYRSAVIYYNKNDFIQTFQHLHKAYQLSVPKNKILPVEYGTYREEIPALFADVALKLNRKKLAKDIIEQVLQEIPTSSRFINMYQTLQPGITRVRKKNQPLIVFHSGTKWCPRTLQNCSGAEIILQNIAKELAKRNKFVCVFLSGINCIVDGVVYKSESEYQNFLNQYYVDTLIVSRFSSNLIYPVGVQKVYLWLHDLLPQGNAFQTEKNRFKGVLCLCQWHKKYFCRQFNFPPDLVHVTRNAIKSERFFHRVEKIPYRFIYSSSPQRGLENLLKIFPRIKRQYPTATLYIFCKREEIPEHYFSLAIQCDDIFWSNRIDQDQLATEFLRSDIWLYPTTWKETYCITALEAQASRVLCACYAKGSLLEIVGKRGIIASTEDELLKKLFFVLERPTLKEALLDKAERWAKSQTIVKLVDEWEERFL
jgi:glycosyltransferase involved in cell wall biosynthesis